MPIRKKIFVLLFIFSCFFFFVSCGTSSNLLVKEPDFQTTVKKILVIPVYTGDELLPKLPKKLNNLDFNKKYRNSFYKGIKKTKSVTNKIVVDTLKNGKFKLETVVLKENISKKIVKYRDKIKINSIDWPFNYSYALRKEVIPKLIDKYKVDAVYFQYLQVKKQEELFYIDGGKLDLPIYQLFYSSLIMTKTKMLFFAQERLTDIETYSQIENTSKYRSVKIDVEKVLNIIQNKKNIDNWLVKYKRGAILQDFVAKK